MAGLTVSDRPTMSRDSNFEILRLMLLLETNIGCKKIVANERKMQQV